MDNAVFLTPKHKLNLGRNGNIEVLPPATETPGNTGMTGALAQADSSTPTNPASSNITAISTAAVPEGEKARALSAQMNTPQTPKSQTPLPVTVTNGDTHAHSVSEVVYDGTIAQIVDYKTTLTNKVSEAIENLSISAAASIKLGTLSASGGGSYVQEEKVKGSDLTYVLNVKVTNDITVYDINDMAFNSVTNGVKDQATFISAYGDGFISGFVKGGEFSAIVTMTAKDQSKLQDVKANLKLDTTAFHGEGQGSWNKTSNDSLSEINYSVNWKGGGQIKDPTAVWDMPTILQAATEFPSRVSKYPETCFAIVTRYEHLNSFVAKPPGWWHLNSIQYDLATVYTNDLLDSFLEYKSILKQLNDIISNSSNYEKANDPEAFSPDWRALIPVKSEVKKQMALIVKAVLAVTANPDLALEQSIGAPLLKNTVAAGTANNQPGSNLSDSPGIPGATDMKDPQEYRVKLPVTKSASSDTDKAGIKPITLAGSPKAIHTLQGVTEIFAVGSDHQLWHKWYSDPKTTGKLSIEPTLGSWEPFTDKILLSAEHNIVPVYRGTSTNDLRDVFAIGADSKLWRKRFENNVWQPWENVSDRLWACAPSVVASGDKHIDVALRDFNGHLWLLTWDNGTWSEPKMIGSPKDTWAGPVTLASISASSTDMWCFTFALSGAMYRTLISGGIPEQSSDLLPEGCGYSFAPSSVTGPNETVGLFWIGNNENGGFTTAIPRRGAPIPSHIFIQEPGCTSAMTGATIDGKTIFAFVVHYGPTIDTVSLVAHQSSAGWDPAGWGSTDPNRPLQSGEIIISGPVYGDPSAVVEGDGIVTVFIKGLGTKIWRNSWDGKKWGIAEEI